MSPTVPAAPAPDGAPVGAPTDAAARPAAAAPAPRERDAFFDNAKFVVIVLVVMGHTWEPLRDASHTLKALYLFVYSFHMPVMIVAAGYMAKNFDSQPRRIKKLITGIAVPYVVFETAYTLVINATEGGDHPLSLYDPLWLTWFLLALFIWRLLAPIWRVVRWPLAVAVVISLLSSLTQLPDALELYRTLELLPFFVAGMVLRREHFSWLHRRGVRIAAVAVLAGAAGMAYLAAPYDVMEFFFWRTGRPGFPEMGFAHWAVLRVACLGCAAVATAAVLALVPERRTWYTRLGEGTMYTYLLHGFLVKLAAYAGLYDMAFVHKPLGIAAVTVVAAGVAVALTTVPVRKCFRWVMEPRLEWAFR
ncbi:acyltransferase family protein [Mangrovactinospora gilvigrisea]|uniref:acyltransferase family protein n=1 Tax=Mangrovactinospora gilvigrisea TaxID=1428644 RepID=UPI001FE6A2F9|nr:acyltransferase family protein [Mangrovactinospora gilvigrisea]